MSIIIIVCVALMFGAMGCTALAMPVRMLRSVGSEPVGRDGRNEVRAVYGGFGLMMAGLLVFATGDSEYRAGILLCVGLALIGMAAGRTVSAAVDRGLSAWMMCIMAGELGTGALLLLVL